MTAQEPPAEPGAEPSPAPDVGRPAPDMAADETAAADPAALQPGRGAPLIPGPPHSVSGPISAGRVNAVFGVGGLLGILIVIVVVVVVGLLLISALSHR